MQARSDRLHKRESAGSTGTIRNGKFVLDPPGLSIFDVPHQRGCGIEERATRAGVRVSSDVAHRLAAYLDLLAHWNQKINLTALPLTPPRATSIDRLIIEPLIAASEIRASDQGLMDLGSGAGSPGLPLKIAAPHVRLVLAEAKARKAAFLREAVRALGLEDVTVEQRRIEDLAVETEADVISLRAVRADADLWTAVRRLLAPGGRVLWFGASGTPAGFVEEARRPLTGGSFLGVLRKTDAVFR